MSEQRFEFNLPVGRIVQGDLYTANDKDQNGAALKNLKGEPKILYFFAVAIPKTQADAAPLVQLQQNGFDGRPVQVPGFVCSPWGQVLLNAAFSDPQLTPGHQMPRDTRFAWKVVDGDSTELGGGNQPKRICDYEGFAGHWIVKFSTTLQPRIFDSNLQPLLQEGVVKRGFYVQVTATATHNHNRMKPGIYINPDHVIFRGYGQEIQGGFSDPRTRNIDLSAPLPAGASATPVSTLPVGAPSSATPAGAALPVPSNTMVAGAPVAPNGPSGWAPAPAAAAPVAVAPNPGFLPSVGAPLPAGQPGIAPAAGAVAPGNPALIPPPPRAPAGPVMTSKANGATYEQFRANGWTDDAMRAQGYLV